MPCYTYIAGLFTTYKKFASYDVSAVALEVCYAHTLTTERAFVTVTPYTFIREMSRSPVWNTGYSERGLSYFHSVVSAKFCASTSIKLQHILFEAYLIRQSS